MTITKTKTRKILFGILSALMVLCLTLGIIGVLPRKQAFAAGVADTNFLIEGGTYTRTDATEAGTNGDGIDFNITPTEDGGDVTMTLMGRHLRYTNSTSAWFNSSSVSWWGGRVRLGTSDDVDARIMTYTSPANASQEITFISTTDGLYISLTSDITMKGNVPYITGSDVALPLIAEGNLLHHGIVDFRPTTEPGVVGYTSQGRTPEISTTEMFKFGSAFSDFSLTDEADLTTLKESVPAKYAYRYTSGWINELCKEMGRNDTILKFRFVGVPQEGATLKIYELNSRRYDSDGEATGATLLDTFEAPRAMLVQKSAYVNYDAKEFNINDLFVRYDPVKGIVTENVGAENSFRTTENFDCAWIYTGSTNGTWITNAKAKDGSGYFAFNPENKMNANSTAHFVISDSEAIYHMATWKIIKGSATTTFAVEGGGIAYAEKGATTMAATPDDGAGFYVVPETDGGDVKLTLMGAHKRYYGLDTNAWDNGRLILRNDGNSGTDLQGRIVTYRSPANQDYAISFITVGKNVYYALTDDIVIKNGAPYINGSDTPLTAIATFNDNRASRALILCDYMFKPTSKPGPVTNSNPVLRENNFRAFSGTTVSILSESDLAAQKAIAPEQYKDRYTLAWTEELCSELSANLCSILEIKLMGVKAAGCLLEICNFGGSAKTTFVADTDYSPLLVQTNDTVKLAASTSAVTMNGFVEVWSQYGVTSIDDYWEKKGTASPRIEYKTSKTAEYTYDLNPNACTTGLQNGYNVMRPGVAGQGYVYNEIAATGIHDSNYVLRARFNVLSAQTVTTESGTESVYLPTFGEQLGAYGDEDKFVAWSIGDNIYAANSPSPFINFGEPSGTVTPITLKEFSVAETASARISTKTDGTSGLRFTSCIDKATYDQLVALQDSGKISNLTITTTISSLNSSKTLTATIKPETLYGEGDYYYFNTVLGNVKDPTRIFYADSAISFTCTDGTKASVQASVVEGREGRSYAQVVAAALADVSDTQTDTATYFWDGKYHGLSQNAYNGAAAIMSDIKATHNVVYTLTFEGDAKNYATQISEYMAANPVKIGQAVDKAALSTYLGLPEDSSVLFGGEYADGVADERGLHLIISIGGLETIVKDGASTYSIVYGSDVTEYVAGELYDAVKASTGASLTKRADNGSTGGKVISIGTTAYSEAAEITAASAGVIQQDGFAIKYVNGNYIIVGGSNEGNLYGVYEFVRQLFDVEYLTYDYYDYYWAATEEPIYAKRVDIVVDPDFAIRDYYCNIIWTNLQARETRLGFNAPSEAQNGNITNTYNDSGAATSYGGDVFKYYYGDENGDETFKNTNESGSESSWSVSALGHSVQGLLQADALLSGVTKTFGEKGTGNGQWWPLAYTSEHEEWYALDKDYKNRVNNRTDLEAPTVDDSNMKINTDTGRSMEEICWTNGLDPDTFTYTAGDRYARGSVIEKLIEICIKMIEDERNANATYLVLGFADWYVECQCDNCLNAYRKFGGTEYTYGGYEILGNVIGATTSVKYGFGGTVANTVNEIAKAVKAQLAAKGITREIKFVTMGYQRGFHAPVDGNGNALLELDEDVVVQLCYRNCVIHGLNDESCTHNESLREEIANWQKVGKEFAIWDYTANFVDYFYYIPNYTAMQSNYKAYKEMGVSWVQTQGATTESAFYDDMLHAYLASKLMWNVNANVADVLNEFDEKYFGSAADVVKAYRAAMDKMYADNNIHATTWGTLDFDGSAASAAKFDVDVLNAQVTALQTAIDNADAETALRLKSVIVTPMYMLLDMNLVTGNDRTAMLTTFKEYAAALGMTTRNEAKDLISDMT